MGQSTDAMLFWGYVWDEEDMNILGLPEDEDAEWDHILLMADGYPDPWASYRAAGIDNLPYPEDRAAFKEWQTANDGANRKALDAYYEAKRELAKASLVDIGHHCSGDYPMPFVFIKDSYKRAWRGESVEIDASALIEDVGWERHLNEFCDKLKIDTSEAKGPGWFLVSYWG